MVEDHHSRELDDVLANGAGAAESVGDSLTVRLRDLALEGFLARFEGRGTVYRVGGGGGD